jgi:hypothetical protein
MGDEICYPAKDCRFLYSPPHLLKFDMFYFQIFKIRVRALKCDLCLSDNYRLEHP